MLDFLWDSIDCECIDIIRFGKVRDGERQIAIVDDNGRLNGSKINMIASVLLRMPVYGTVLFGIETGDNIRGYNPVEGMCARYAIDRTLSDSGLFKRKDNDSE